MRRNVIEKILLIFIIGFGFSIDAFAQQIVIKGLVKDATGEPVIGANVAVKETRNDTNTDLIV